LLVWTLNLSQEVESLCDDELLVPFACTMCFFCLVFYIHTWKTSLCFICFIFSKWTCYHSLFHLHMMNLFLAFDCSICTWQNFFFFTLNVLLAYTFASDWFALSLCFDCFSCTWSICYNIVFVPFVCDTFFFALFLFFLWLMNLLALLYYLLQIVCFILNNHPIVLMVFNHFDFL